MLQFVPMSCAVQIIFTAVLALVLTARANSTLQVTNIADLASLRETDIKNKTHINLIGTIARIKPHLPSVRGKNNEFRIWIRSKHHIMSALGPVPPNTSAGSVVHIEGFTDLVKNQAICRITKISALPDAIASPTEPVVAKIHDLNQNPLPYQIITVRGKIIETFTDDIDPGFVYFEVSDGTSALHASIISDEIDAEELSKIVGSEVSLTGVYLPQNASVRRFMGPILLILSKTDVNIIKPASFNPYEYPDCPCDDSYSPTEIQSWNIRKLTGRVLASWQENNILVETDDGTMHHIELSHGQSLPSNGDRITVAGQACTDYFHINLTRAFYTISKPATSRESTGVPSTPRSFPLNEYGGIDGTYYGHLIRISGTLMPPTAAFHNDHQLFLNYQEHIVSIDIGATGYTDKQFELGSKVEVTGICHMDIDNWRPGDMFPKIRGISLITRSPADIRVLATPPWWTPAKFMGFTIAFLVVLVIILIWNRSLKFLVNRRSRELLREQVSHASAILKAEERTRLSVELHDSLSQNLAGVACQIDTTEYALHEDPPSAADHLTTAKRMLQSCQQELKRCLFDLRCDALNEDNLEDAIRTTLKPVIGSAQLALRFNVPRAHLLDTTAHALICIIRELASNAVRHGLATKLYVAGDLTDDLLSFSVRDNGTGFDRMTSPGPGEGHFGLQGIRDRVDRLHGVFSMESSTAGTYAKITIHLSNKTAKAL